MNANQIKKELKEAGIPTKKISVRCDGSVHVTIKDLSISIEAVEKVVKKHEHYQRDEYNGEILQGGNTFVFVDYDWGLKAEWYKNEAFAQEVLKEFKGYFGTGVVYLKHAENKASEWSKNSHGLAQEALKDVVGSVLAGNLENLKEVGLELKRG